MDQIKITNLEVFSNHGVYSEENTLGQKFLVSAILYMDTRPAGHSDAIEQSIHYGEVCHAIKSMMQDRTYKLLETVAETIATQLLITYSKLEKIEVEIKKPWAPIMLPIDTVSVKIERQWHRVFLGMGANLGERHKTICKAIETLNTFPDIKVIHCSDSIETEPYGYMEQPCFINACIEIQTLKTPEELLIVVNQIETEAGRTRDIHWGPRTLDIDILFYDSIIYDSDTLCIPHPQIPKRYFVLKPMAQIAPYYHHPISGKTMEALLEEVIN